MSSNQLVLWFEELKKEDISLVGGKCAKLGEMAQAEIPVPLGFVVTSLAYKKFIEDRGIDKKIHKTVSKIVDIDNQYQEISKKVRRIIDSTTMTPEIEKTVIEAYHKLSRRIGITQAFVAVRSSATTENLSDSSFAGQYETYLNVRGDKDLIKKIIKCWSSLFTPRAIFYRFQRDIRHEEVLMSVGVQKMVNAKAAGVIFTINPATGKSDEIVIEGSWGLGVSVVSGSITPDIYIIDKNTLKIVDKKISKKALEYIRDPKTGQTIQNEVSSERQEQPCLNDREIVKLAELAKQIEGHFMGRAQDIEWAIDQNLTFPENIFIVQSRPETVWSITTSPI